MFYKQSVRDYLYDLIISGKINNKDEESIFCKIFIDAYQIESIICNLYFKS